MIDLHCHICYGMDDGAKDVNESVRMLKAAKSNDIDVIIATPHFLNYNMIDDFVIERDSQIKELNELAQTEKIATSIGTGAEVYLDRWIFTADNIDELAINNTRYMLCEYSLRPFDAEYAVLLAEEVINKGYIPIIAHPERYITFLQNKAVINELWKIGCRFQVNAASLAGHGGEDMQEFTTDIITRGFADFIATDAHSSTIRGNDIKHKIGEFPTMITESEIINMTQTAPLIVIKNGDLPVREPEMF